MPAERVDTKGIVQLQLLPLKLRENACADEFTSMYRDDELHKVVMQPSDTWREKTR